MQQTRRRRHLTGATQDASAGKTTVLPLRVDSGGHNHRSSSSKKRRLLVLIATVMAITCIVISLCFLLLQSGRSTPQSPTVTNDNIPHSDGNTPQVIRISSTDNADYTEFIPCIDNVNEEPYLSKLKPVLQDYRSKSRIPAYSELMCSPKDKERHCFRAVHDGFSDLLDMAKQHGDGHSELHNRIAVLIESLLLKPGVPLQRDDHQISIPTMLQVSIHRTKTYLSSGERVIPSDNQLHADYLENADYVYTAILYEDPPDDLVGGETGLVNFRNNNHGQGDDVTFGMQQPVGITDGITDGVIVEPKRGRLVLFSSGAENFHSPMKIQHGNRPTYHFWFKCKGVKSH